MDKTYFDRLRGRRTEVEKTLRHVENERRTVESNREWAGAAYESRIDLLECLTDWYREETARIDDALKWDDQGRYGLCFACHEPIEAERMRFCAETELCFDCQQDRERLGTG